MKYLFFLLVGLFVFVVFSCKSGNEESPQAEVLEHSNDIMYSLVGNKMKEWKIDSYKVNGTNILSEMDDCIIDNMDIYFADHRFESVEGSLKCKTNDPYITETGHWFFNGDSTEIEVSIDKDFYILRIIELSTLKLHYISYNHEDTIEAILSPANM